MSFARIALSVAFFALAIGANRIAAQEVKVFTQLTPDQTEDLLKKFGIDAKKIDTKNAGTIFYDYKKGNYAIRLYHFAGKDLMLDAVFPKLPLEKINEWNVKAKFSRACIHKDNKGEYMSLESNIDLIGGVTEGALKQFFTSFDDEVALFVRFAGSSTVDDQLFSPVTSDRIEAVLKSLNIAFEKNELKGNAGQFYDFEASKFKLRLVNFGGKDLMIDAHFKKIPLEDINRWNLEKKFIRAVQYSVKGTEYTALECNLDCEVGTTEGILRNFIVGFQEDVKEFAKYVQDK